MDDEEREPELPEPPERERSGGGRMFTATQLVIVFAITCALWLGLDFSRRIASAQRIQGAVVQLQQDLDREQARNAALKTELAYTQSDEYVEHWARSDMKMVRPGEHLVVPVGPTPAPVVATPAPPPAPPPPWAVWWALLTGDTSALTAPAGP